MKRLLSVLLVLLAFFATSCDFLGSDRGDGDGNDSGEDNTLVVDEK